MAQYISANAKILLKITDEGLAIDGIKSNLSYTAKTGDYLQVSETSLVILLDNEHCKQVNEENRPWDYIERDKVYFHIKPVQDNHKLSKH